MFCTNCGSNINEGAKFCQYCGMKTVIASKNSMTEETVPNYPGAEYTIVYPRNGQGESRVKKLSDGYGYQSDGRTADGQDRGGFYTSETQPASAYGSNTGGYMQETGHTQEMGHAQTNNGRDSNAPDAFESASEGFPGNAAGGAGSAAENRGWDMTSPYGAEMHEYASNDRYTGNGGPNTASAEAYTSKVFNSPVLNVAGLREGDSNQEHSGEEKDDKKGNGILIALIVILILLILLVGFSAFAYIQGLIDF